MAPKEQLVLVPKSQASRDTEGMEQELVEIAEQGGDVARQQGAAAASSLPSPLVAMTSRALSLFERRQEEAIRTQEI
eukprot:1697438-Lingulodinium_polyedra.AAC.1